MGARSAIVAWLMSADRAYLFGVASEDALERILERASGDLDALGGRRVLVTGATGFFGAWLLATLATARHARSLDIEIIALSRSASAFRAEYSGPEATVIRWVDADVRNLTAPDLLPSSLDDIVHLATPASATLNAEAPTEMLDIIHAGTKSVIECAVRTGARRMLLASSGAVYGVQPASLEHVPESYPGAPDPLDVGNAYHEGKRLAELALSLAGKATGLEGKVARCFAFSGAGLPLDRHFAFGNFVRDAALGRPIHVAGDGRAVRSYLDAEDLVVWLLGVWLRGLPSRAYNVGAERAVTIRELGELVGRAGGVPVEVAQSPGGTPAHRYVPSTERARSELGLGEWTSLETSIERALAWARARRTDS